MPTAPTQSPSINEDVERQIYAYVAYRTESGDDPSAIYRLSHAKTPKSGYSFGRVQVDLAWMKAERKELLQAVYAWLVAEGRKPDAAWVKNVTQQLSKTGDESALSTKYKEDINDYMATAAGHVLVDKISGQSGTNMLASRKKDIFERPSAALLLKDPQSLAYIYKSINAENPEKLKAFLSGKAVTFSTRAFTVPEGQGFDISAMLGMLQERVKSSGPVHFDEDGRDATDATVLAAGTRVLVKKEGFFVESPNRRFRVTKDPIALDLAYHENQRLKFKTGNETYRLIKGVSGKIQGQQITFNGATFDRTTETQLTPQQVSGEQPISPQEFYQKYAALNQYSKTYTDAVRKIYFDDAAFFSHLKAMPDMSKPVDWTLWYPLDPKNRLPVNVKTAIADEWAKDARSKDKRPFDLNIIDEYLKANRRVQGEVLRAVAPNEGANITDKKAWPGQASTHQILYLGPDGKERRIAYRVKNDLLADGKRGLAEASHSPEGLAALDIAVNTAAFPSEAGANQGKAGPMPVQTPGKGRKRQRVTPKPPAVHPQKNLLDRLQFQSLPTPIRFDGPVPLRRAVGPSPNERAQIEADTRMSAALAAFDREENLRTLIAAEVAEQLKPPPGRSPFEEAVLCGYNLYSYA